MNCSQCKTEITIKGLAKSINAGMTAGIGHKHGDMICALFAEFTAAAMEVGLCMRCSAEPETKLAVKDAMLKAISAS